MLGKFCKLLAAIFEKSYFINACSLFANDIQWHIVKRIVLIWLDSYSYAYANYVTQICKLGINIITFMWIKPPNTYYKIISFMLI